MTTKVSEEQLDDAVTTKINLPGTITGSVVTWPLGTPPTDYLECDGSVISRTTYADLFAVVGTLYGVGDGSTTFDLPDYRGEFLRGFDNGRGVDSGRGIGSFQADAFKSHNHPNPFNSGGAVLMWHFTSRTYATGGWGLSSDYSGGTETRPRNLSVMYCIKY